MIWTAEFWKGASERALKTFAQTLAAMFVVGVPLFDLDFVQGLQLAGTAALASLLTSIGSADFTSGARSDVVLTGKVTGE